MSYGTFVKQHTTPPTKTAKKVHTTHWLSRHKWHIKLSVIGVALFVGAASSALWWFWEQPLVTPLTSLSTFRFLQQPESDHGHNKVVYGFLPYWNLSDAVLQPELTHLSYFALTIGGNGEVRLQEDGSVEPGFNKLKSEQLLDIINLAAKQDTQFELVLSQFLADDIAAFLASEKAQQRLIETLDGVILAYPISGINIDIELNGTPSERQRQQLVTFMTNLRQHLDARYKGMTLSIDVYAGASNNKQLWDIVALEPVVDYFVVMAYDFHRRTSPQAGPVAPLFGGSDLWDSDINEHLRAFLEYLPKEKILLGVPFYGYEWQTENRSAQSSTFPETGSTAKITRVKELLAKAKELKVEEHWNEEALSPYLTYVEDGETYVLYYEDSRSLSYKLDYVNQLDLAGIAIWALGYEGDARELWDVINRKLD
ncbi:MAG: glycosyl hydrolase family 18 protein [bacterium]|nr:glycosyl hydrolase family 18 protein [bacterium]